MQNLSTTEPWLSPLSQTLHTNVLGFISFLEKRKAMFKPGSIEEREINEKIQQLADWRTVAEQIILSTSSPLNLKASSSLEKTVMERVSKSLCFLDNLKINSEEFEIFNTMLSGSGKIVKVLAPKHAFATMNHNLSFPVPVPQSFAPTFEEESEEESKASEAIFYNMNSAQSRSNALPIGVNAGRDLKSGFIFDKCLRRVKLTRESRDIFTAFRCYYEETGETKRIVRIDFNDKYIIKRVGKVRNMVGFEACNHKLKREFKTQQLLTTLNHENINKLVHYFEDDFNIYTVSASAGPSDMLDLIAEYTQKFKQGFAEDIVQKLFKKVVEALTTVHNLGIAHRDISLENLVLNNYGLNFGKQEKVEIIDWGHCVGVGADGQVPYEGALGKVKYMSPELVFGAKEGLKRYDARKADVFALGVSLFTLLTGNMPFERVDDLRAKRLSVSVEELIGHLNVVRKRREQREIVLSENAKDLLNKTLKWNPSERASMSEILEHPFFNC